MASCQVRADGDGVQHSRQTRGTGKAQNNTRRGHTETRTEATPFTHTHSSRAAVTPRQTERGRRTTKNAEAVEEKGEGYPRPRRPPSPVAVVPRPRRTAARGWRSAKNTRPFPLPPREPRTVKHTQADTTAVPLSARSGRLEGGPGVAAGGVKTRAVSAGQDAGSLALFARARFFSPAPRNPSRPADSALAATPSTPPAPGAR